MPGLGFTPNPDIATPKKGRHLANRDIGRWALLAVSASEKKSDGETATSSDCREEPKLLLSWDFIKVSYMHG